MWCLYLSENLRTNLVIATCSCQPFYGWCGTISGDSMLSNFVRNNDDAVSCEEGSAGDKDYTQSEHVRKVNGNDSDQNKSANDAPAYRTYMALEAGRPAFPP